MKNKEISYRWMVRDECGCLELAPHIPGAKGRAAWQALLDSAEHVQWVEPLVGWGQYTDLYKVSIPWLGEGYVAVAE